MYTLVQALEASVVILVDVEFRTNQSHRQAPYWIEAFETLPDPREHRLECGFWREAWIREDAAGIPSERAAGNGSGPRRGQAPPPPSHCRRGRARDAGARQHESSMRREGRGLRWAAQVPAEVAEFTAGQSFGESACSFPAIWRVFSGGTGLARSCRS